MRLVKNSDAADGQQYDALRGNTGASRHQCMPKFVQNDASENDAYQTQYPQGDSRILGGGSGTQQKDEQKQKRKMNAYFDSKETPDRDGPTTHRHAYQYSIYLDTA